MKTTKRAVVLDLDGLTDVQRGWIVGVIEGEGCIEIRRMDNKKFGKVYFQPSLRVANTDERMPLRLKEMLGGRIHPLYNQTSARHVCWQWCMDGPGVGQLLEHLAPFFQIKGEQAALIVEFYRDQPAKGYRNRMPEGESDRREELRTRLFAAKKAPLTVIGVGAEEAV